MIAKFYPEQNIPKDDASYVEGMFNAICGMQASRNDSLSAARKTVNSTINVNSAYEKWLEQSAPLWSVPLAGSVR